MQFCALLTDMIRQQCRFKTTLASNGYIILDFHLKSTLSNYTACAIGCVQFI